MLHIGCHLSTSQGFLHMGKEALSIGGNTFQFFTRNPRGGVAKPFNQEDADALIQFMKDHDFAPILAHAPYTLNACSADPRLREFARATMADDLARMEHIPGNMYNFHPGSHVQQGTEQGILYIAEMLNTILTPNLHTTVLLETMAGKGSEVGRTFEELREIIDRTECNNVLGICLDTCHVYDGGYDIVTNLGGVLESFDKIIGLERLKAVHLNDSKNSLGSHKDRHETIGNGYIGLDALIAVINHPSLRNLPFYLETPNDISGYQKEISLMRNKYME